MAYSQPASSFPTSHPESNLSSASTATTATAAYPTTNYYQVFINHRGPDVKKTFVSSLYHCLTSYHKLKVFLDKREMEQGEYITSQIKGAIGSASVQVAVFSPGYAKSRWCLDELVLMMKSCSTIIPVFHKVNPSDLKRTGLYAKDLETYEAQQRFDSATIEDWRNALLHVSGISGFELEACNGDEGELLEKVVNAVLKKVEETSFEVAKYPCGVDAKVKDFEKTVKLQQQQSGKLLVVGIVGLPGVGKTTLAKELFNRMSSQYSKSCFLTNKNRDENSLKKELLKKLTGSDMGTDNINEVIKNLEKQAIFFQAFVILDDVNHVDQVDAVLFFQTVLSSDSKILITSRDRDVLTSSEVKNFPIYKLSGLNTQHSRELFCLHAFGQPHPLPGFESLVDKYLKPCDGLPLSLTVLGTLLRGKHDRRRWEAELDRLQETLPEGIEKRLRISYGGLGTDEKEIFLDIASFFIGENRDMAIRIWEGSRVNVWLPFQNLESKSLIEVDSENKIKMHDHVRDMGRKEAEEASGLPRRLWLQTQNIDDLLQLYNGQVRGIRTARDHDTTKVPYRKNCQKPSNTMLQLLDVEDGDLVRILNRLHLANLIWLRWRNCSYASLPHWVPKNNLRVLEVNSNVLNKLWQGEKQAPFQLRELVITSPLTELPKSIGKLEHLELIILRCPSGNLKTLPNEFCELQSLKRFELINCSEIKSLPDFSGSEKLERLADSCGYLTSLEYINLSGSKKLERLPDYFGRLRSLKCFKLTDCSEIKSLPDSFRYLTKLEHIDLSGSEKLERLPDSFGCLRSLKRFKLTDCSEIKSLPDSFRDLTNLEHIDLSGSEKLERLPDFREYLTSVEYINLSGLKKLERLPDSFGPLQSLKHFKLTDCSELKSLPDSLGCLTRLEHIDLSRSKTLVGFPDSFGKLQSMKRFELPDCPKIKSLPDSLGYLTNLEHIDLSRSESLQRLPNSFGDLIRLKYLDLRGCNNLTISDKTLENIRTLECINLSYCRKIKLLPLPVAYQLSLEKLYCPFLEMIPSPLGGNLKELKLFNDSICKELKCLPISPELLNQLTKLTVKECVFPEGVFKKDEGKTGETGTSSLGQSRGERALSHLSSSIGKSELSELQHFELEKTDISEVSFAEVFCRNLQHLRIMSCNHLVKVGTLPNRLITLELFGCCELKKIEGLCGLAKLQTLTIKGCTKFEQLSSIERLESLEVLNVRGSSKLRSIEGLAQLTKLRQLEIVDCSELEELAGVEHLMSLTWLDAFKCPKLQWGKGVEQLRQRQWVKFRIDEHTLKK